MKITLEHLEVMRQAVDKVLADNPDCAAMYEQGRFHNADKVRDLQLRFCSDIGYAAGLSKFYCNTIYKYANDAHIYTAMKKLCPTVTRAY